MLGEHGCQCGSGHRSPDREIRHLAEVGEHEHPQRVASVRFFQHPRGGAEPSGKAERDQAGSRADRSLANGAGLGGLDGTPGITRPHLARPHVMKVRVVGVPNDRNHHRSLLVTPGLTVDHVRHDAAVRDPHRQCAGEQDGGLQPPPFTDLGQPRHPSEPVDHGTAGNHVAVVDVSFAGQDGRDSRTDRRDPFHSGQLGVLDVGDMSHANPFDVGDGDASIDPLYAASVECTEEAILNALCMAEPMTGLDGHAVPALPLREVRQILRRYGRIPDRPTAGKSP